MFDDSNFELHVKGWGWISAENSLVPIKTGMQVAPENLLFYDIILLFKSVQGGRRCLKITKSERTYFMDGPLWKN